ncbi:MAG: hypothetical protein ACI37Q_00500 [Candidatus Gastranaerophilaceae bacterium]
MIINSGIINKASKLFVKTLGSTVQEGAVLKTGEHLAVMAPASSRTYDYFEGVGKKGRFIRYAFKNEDGKTIQHYTRYIADDGKVKDVVTDFAHNNPTYSSKRTTINAGTLTDGDKFIPSGEVEDIYTSSMLFQNFNGKLLVSKSFVDELGDKTFGGFELLRAGKKPIGFNYEFKWDGSPTEIKYKRIKQKLDLNDTEMAYLPFCPREFIIATKDGQQFLLSSDLIDGKIPEKIGLSQLIQEKLHNIKGIMPRAKSVKTEDLHLVKTSDKSLEELKQAGMLPHGEQLGNGQINLVTDIASNSDGVVILDLMAHEMQHGADTITMYRGGEEAFKEALKRVGINAEEYNKLHENEFKDLDGAAYMKKVISKLGLFKKGTPEYNQAVDLYEMSIRQPVIAEMTKEQHDMFPLEVRAIEREKQQLSFFNLINQKITNFLVGNL